MSSPNITFDNIPASIRKPGVYSEFKLNAGKMALPANDISMLIIAQRLEAASAWQATTAYSLGDIAAPVTSNGHYYICVVAGTSDSSAPTWPTTAGTTVADATVTWMEYAPVSSLIAALTPTKVYNAAEAAAYFGEGSQAHLMVQAALSANPALDLTVCAVNDDGSAVKATGSFAISGTATEAGTMLAYIGNVQVSISIAVDDTAAATATALTAAINAKKSLLPCVATAASGTVTIRAKNGGTVGNQIYINCTTDAGGLSITPTAMASGATDPDLGAVSGALDVVFPGEYDLIAVALNDSDNLGDLKDHCESVSGSTEKRPAIGVFGYTDLTGNIAAVKTLCGTTLNHWRMSGAYLPNSKSISFEIAAAYAAVIASESDPAMPLNNLSLDDIAAPEVANRLSRSQQEDLLDYGVTPLHVIPGEKVAIVRAITTYIRNSQGVTDATRLDITTPRSLDYVRLSCDSAVSNKFGRAKNSVRNRREVRSVLLSTLYSLEDLQVVEDVSTWEEYLIVEQDTQDDTRANARIPAKIIRGMHVIANRIDLI